MAMAMSPILMYSASSGASDTEGEEGASKGRVVWVRSGEVAPFSGYLLDKDAGAYQTARLRLVEGKLEIAINELRLLSSESLKAGRALEVCESEGAILRSVIDAQEDDGADVGSQVVWGVAGFGVGVAAGLIVLFVGRTPLD